jgi:chaperonin cofactor prefoldin
MPDAILRAMDDSTRAAVLRAFEGEAEILAVHQLDLLAQLEAQLRAVQHTMRCIEKLRATRHRVGPELTDVGRGETLKVLASELEAIDNELRVQHQSCEDMQRTIGDMQARLKPLRRTVKT